jgi:NAD(P)-dependent dehydrogenase (short-subunit alcohol dehydrogenase family)
MKQLSSQILISHGNLSSDSLKGEVAIVTGGGKGIGYEASRALLWLGARVIIAERDEGNGKRVTIVLQNEFGRDRVLFVKTDVGNEDDVAGLTRVAEERFGKVDVVLNNAAVEPISAVKDAGVDLWDAGYHVNLRGPALLARTFLAGMIRRKHGVFVCVSSSGAAPYMGPYEVFKTAQVELANTIAAEVEGTGVFAFTIGPGIVRTPGLLEGGSKVAALMGISLDNLIEMNKSALLTPEEAGVGFAASIALASKYHGTETSSIQVLRDIGIAPASEDHPQSRVTDSGRSTTLFEQVLKTYDEQSKGWKERNIFQKQWVFRDFKKQTGMSLDQMQSALTEIGDSLKRPGASTVSTTPLVKLGSYYKHQQELLQGFEKDPKKLHDNLASIQTWIEQIQSLISSLE